MVADEPDMCERSLTVSQSVTRTCHCDRVKPGIEPKALGLKANENPYATQHIKRSTRHRNYDSEANALLGKRQMLRGCRNKKANGYANAQTGSRLNDIYEEIDLPSITCLVPSTFTCFVISFRSYKGKILISILFHCRQAINRE